MKQAGHASYDVAVVGGGATGYAAALVAVRAGLSTVLFAPPAAFPPGRTAALLQGSIHLLSELDAWPALAAEAAPLRAIRIADATRRLIRAPESTFYASEIGLAQFGFNVANSALVEALHQQVLSQPGLALVPEPVDRFEADPAEVRLDAGGTQYTARVIVAADGARSKAREAAGIAVREWSHHQSALVARLAIEQPHNGVSTEFHTENGPFTLVPLQGNAVSLVWMNRPEAAHAASLMEAEEFERAAELQAHSIHGAMRLDGRRAVFPLRAALAERFAARRTVLVGEAAHVFPPIGAQGLNLGFRDVASLGAILARHAVDPGSPEALAAYHASRQGDVRTRTLAVDLLNRSILTDFLPVQAARGLGIGLTSSIRPLRRALMRYGLAPG